MRSHRRYAGSWLALSRRKKLLHWPSFSFFRQSRILYELNKIKKRYHLTFSNPRKLTIFNKISQLRFPYATPALQRHIEQAHQELQFSAGMIDYLHQGEPFFLGISQRTAEWIDVFLFNHANHAVDHYRYHIFERYWQNQQKPTDAMQIRATINIYLDEILYLVAENMVFSPFKATLKLPTVELYLHQSQHMFQV